jgi:NADPH:quinone reductase-like Zn-dependent oxidoreductase
MQAAGIDAFGGEVHMLELAAPPSPAPDEVVIAVHAAGVGNWDEIVRLGHWDVGRRPPLALGVEAAGVVAAVGEDVTTLAQRRRGAQPTHCRCDTRAPGRSGLSLPTGRPECETHLPADAESQAP